MLPFQLKPKFILDENVKLSLEGFLKSKGFEVFRTGKGMLDKELASKSIKEKLVVVTNDSDFANPDLYSPKRIFSVVWLRIPQSDKKKLIDSFDSLLEKVDSFEGKIIVLKADNFSISSFENIS